ncbi:hypothetical protein OF83DRAFT_1085556 [Amylostereum chailletii]|nr:hypothetical protein OF83DRAFT_1085556 [Amylostereum chailletii]
MSIAERALDYIRAYRAIIPIDIDDIDGRDFQEEIDETMCHLRSLPLVRVVQRAQAGDAEMKIELGLRKYSGFGIEKDSEAAFESWNLKAIAEDRQHWTHPLRDVPAVRAILCLCMYRMSTYEEKKDGWDLVQCVLWAEQAAEYGLVTPPGLFAVRQLHQTLASFATPAGARFSEKDEAFYRHETAGIKYMWTFMRRRTDALERGGQALVEKARSTPNKYACAREGCGIRAESQAALRRCGGPCAPERKPHYCSRECQKTVRARFDWRGILFCGSLSVFVGAGAHTLGLETPSGGV